MFSLFLIFFFLATLDGYTLAMERLERGAAGRDIHMVGGWLAGTVWDSANTPHRLQVLFLYLHQLLGFAHRCEEGGKLGLETIRHTMDHATKPIIHIYIESIVYIYAFT